MTAAVARANEALPFLEPTPLEHARLLSVIGQLRLATEGPEAALEVLEQAFDELLEHDDVYPEEILDLGLELLSVLEATGHDTKELEKFLRTEVAEHVEPEHPGLEELP